MVRKQLLVLLAAGYSPMKFFAKDYKKYFYLGELLALIDLSLVRLAKLASYWSQWDLHVHHLMPPLLTCKALT